MPTMSEQRSPEYLRGWLGYIATRTRLADWEVAAILEQVTGQAGAHREGHPEPVDYDRAAEIVGSLTPEQAKRVIALARQEHLRPQTHCRHCGLPLTRGECEECV